jgi:3-hydroxy-3-methylglutaryl CoA synthase
MVGPVGIDDLNLYASSLCIDYASIASARPYAESMLDHVRFLRRSLLPPYEDPVTLAVNAAKPIVDAALPIILSC